MLKQWEIVDGTLQVRDLFYVKNRVPRTLQKSYEWKIPRFFVVLWLKIGHLANSPTKQQ
jgi:hypothetical protein